jgi:tetratricopeptide (TPR) repeat protein
MKQPILRNYSSYFNVLLALTLLAFWTPCHLAQQPAGVSSQPGWPLNGPAFSASVDELQKAAAKITAEKFMEATVLFERDSYSFDAGNRLTYRHTLIYRIESKDGIEGWAQTSMRWEPWHQNKPEIHARVITPDGKVSQLDQKTISEGPATDDEDEPDTYTDARMRKAPLPGLVIGAIVEEEIVEQDKEPFFSGGGVYRVTFVRTVPIVRGELFIDAPAEVNLRYKTYLLPALTISDQVDSGRRHLQFVQNYIPAKIDADINLPSHIHKSPMVEFSTGNTWASVADTYRQLAEPQINPQMAQSLLPVGPASDRMENIRRIVARLHREIRYTGIEFGQAALQPQTPAEILKRHYGDCKDKAALLVSLLRAANIPANLALLSTGPGVDVSPDLPGMDQFDHAIVYVPAANPSDSPLWIDATAEYATVGTLPSMDQGRSALIIAEGTSGLTNTPKPSPEENSLTEIREVNMVEYGAARITETSLTHGEVDENYRSWYGGNETKEIKTALETYAKDHYRAKALTSVEHSDGKDTSKPFTLKLTMAEAKRGSTAIDDAAVVIPSTSLFSRLPGWFRTDPRQNDDKPTPQQEEDRGKAEQARTTEYDVEPFSTEWRYKITPPTGFILRALPEDKTIEMGPARYSQYFEVDAQGVITAKLSFVTDKPRYTLAEVVALRDAVLAAYKQDMIVILLDQQGSKFLAAGKIREAISADRALIAQHPSEAIHHAQMAYALLQANLGDKARQEALKATQLDAKSAIAFKTLGWVCQFNSIATQFGDGFDLGCSIDAYKKAVALDPDDANAITNLLIIQEYNKDGERYGVGSHLTDAIATFRMLKEKDKDTADQYEEYLLYDMVYSGQYKELLAEIAKLPSDVKRDGLAIAATVAHQGGPKGIAAGIERADHLNSGVQQRNTALADAGATLLRLRLYPEATEILSASASGQSNAAAVAQQIAVFKQTTKWNNELIPSTDPRSAVQRYFVHFYSGTFTDENIGEVLARQAYSTDDEWTRNRDKAVHSYGMMHKIAERSGLGVSVLFDVIMGHLQLTSDGTDKTGFNVTLQSIGAKPQHYFIVKQDGKYKIVTDGASYAETGNEALYLIRAGRLDEARHLLDWLRDKMHKGGGDDPLSGPLLPRFWTIGDEHSEAEMKYAAASLMVGDPAIVALLPELRKAWEGSTSEETRLDLALLLSEGYSTAADGENLKIVSDEILKKYPSSFVAIKYAGMAAGMQKHWDIWASLIDAQLARHPESDDLLRLKIEYAVYKGDFILARSIVQQLIDIGKATANDYNTYAWTTLFDDKVDDAALKYAQQSNALGNNTNFSIMHTLACIYAHQGKTAEAKDILLKAMTVDNLSEPNSAVWLAFGLIYEQYGVNDAAMDAYKKVEKPLGRFDPESNYLLAQAHLKAMISAAHN